jgi:hypothetical protein
MALSWLALFEIPQSPAEDGPDDRAISTEPPPRRLAIEVLSNDKGTEHAVLFSYIYDLTRPSRLRCVIGFASPAKATNVWRDRGFPLMDASIRHDGDTIQVTSPYFGKDHPMQYETPLFTVTGVTFDSQKGRREPLQTEYEQRLEAPDPGHPDKLIRTRKVTWQPQRRDTRRVTQQKPKVLFTPSRIPPLAAFQIEKLTLVGVWTGAVDLPKAQNALKGNSFECIPREDIFGAGAFRFENVEVIGFRIDLGRYGRDFTKDLDELVTPLNFHLNESPDTSPIWDFRYRVATPVLLIELLRYGRMRLKSPKLPLVPEDFVSQHELVVRLLVGRVDDDTSQARDPATYVPAIFVDNPWSKVIGRDVQGFDKRMASFCVAGRDGNPVPVLPDGCMHGQRRGIRSPRPLSDISLVRLVQQTGFPDGPDILELEYSFFDYQDWGAYLRLGIDLTLSTLSLASTRWGHLDFTDPEFQRSFSLSAITDSLRRLRSVQLSPVADRHMERAWITGAFTLDDDLRIAVPTGTAHLTLHAANEDAKNPSVPSAPAFWNRLCKMLGDGAQQATLRFPAGSWYRLSGSMDMTVDDGLEWSRPDMLSIF